jgi:predicted nucleic acid-binding protein
LAVLIDSSDLIAWERRGLVPEDVKRVVPNEPAGISGVTASELLVGVHRDKSR